LQTAVADHAPDVVLADPENLQAVMAKFGSGAKAPAVVLVLVRPSRQELDTARKASACVAEMPDWGVSPVLKVVNNIRASQDAGRSAQCSERPGPST
jgi:CO dehydrogenase nickel-insertion accessory protein CooC1